jgi:hypothetical protein
MPDMIIAAPTARRADGAEQGGLGFVALLIQVHTSIVMLRVSSLEPVDAESIAPVSINKRRHSDMDKDRSVGAAKQAKDAI